MASNTELNGLAVSMRDCVDAIADGRGDAVAGAEEVLCETVGTAVEVAAAVVEAAGGVGWEMPRIASRTELNGLDVSIPREVEAGTAWLAAGAAGEGTDGAGAGEGADLSESAPKEEGTGSSSPDQSSSSS